MKGRANVYIDTKHTTAPLGHRTHHCHIIEAGNDSAAGLTCPLTVHDHGGEAEYFSGRLIVGTTNTDNL